MNAHEALTDALQHLICGEVEDEHLPKFAAVPLMNLQVCSKSKILVEQQVLQECHPPSLEESQVSQTSKSPSSYILRSFLLCTLGTWIARSMVCLAAVWLASIQIKVIVIQHGA